MTKLVVWDFDGTLVNSLPTTFAAMNDALEEVLGRKLPAREIVSHFGLPEPEILARILGPALSGQAEPCWRRYLAATESRLHEIALFEGVAQALADVSAAGFRSALFTGRSRRTTDIILNHLHLTRRFERIVAGDEVTSPKPNPEGFLSICAGLGVDPSDAVMIGDTHHDVEAGRAAGARTIACTWDELADRAKLERTGPTHFAAHPREVLPRL